MREFGRARLVESGDQARVVSTLRDWARSQAVRWLQELFSPQQLEVLPAVRAEAGTLDAIVRTAMEERDVATVVPVFALLSALWSIRGDHFAHAALARPVLTVLAQTMDRPEPDSAEADLWRVVVSTGVGLLELFGVPPEPESVELLRSLGDSGQHSAGDAFRAMVLAVTGQSPARRNAEELIADLSALAGPDDEPRTGRPVGVQAERLALLVLAHLLENEGRAAAALEAARRALRLCPPSEGPWLAALVEGQICNLHATLGDLGEAAPHARRAVPVLAACGATADAAQLQSVVVMATVAAGDLELAERELDALSISGISGEEVLELRSGLAVGRAELALARGETDEGLASFRELVRQVQGEQRRWSDAPGVLPEIFETATQAPWVVYAVGATVAVHALHGSLASVAPEAALVDQMLEQFWDNAEARRTGETSGLTAGVDLPVSGTLLLAKGLMLVNAPEAAAADVRTGAGLVALAERFGISRALPSLAPERVRRVVEAAGGVPAYTEMLGRTEGLEADELIAAARAWVDRADG